MGNESDNLQRFIELADECGIDGIADFLAQACEVQAEMVGDEDDEKTAQAWGSMAPELRRLATRAAALYAIARQRREEAAVDPGARAVGEFIGTDTTYVGADWPSLAGQRVRIVALQRGAAAGTDTIVIRDNAALAESGGVRPFDRLEVQPMVGGRSGSTASLYRAIDLECFAALRAPKAK